MLRQLLFSAVLFGLLACEQEMHPGHESELKFVAMEKTSELDEGVSWQQDLPTYSKGYFSEADPASDLLLAKELAEAENKVIMMVIGGDWCSWCHVMTRFFTENEPVRELLLNKFVLLKVNMSEENDNEEFLSKYPKIVGYPHMFIVSAKGELLTSVNTATLESGRSYSEQKFTELIKTY